MGVLVPASFPSQRDAQRRLMTHPQRLGFLPTWWFWRALKWDWPLFCSFLGAAIGAFSVALGWIVLYAGFELPAAFIAALLGPVLGFGVVERGLRALVVRRRRALATGRAELPPGPSGNRSPE
ncbi:hypothetical protein [Nannocystis bainbridge]|uniref:Uncharacterized protein n=1 Tax=Nannocystis bainbridge TaxID=2995303 RepID=A0ABT5DQB1_9BACT|nr:hypothetical protein [Nannocystis bainbridge]MDC0715830.1 hypothetical protein [Nannocystis bainbridge]